MRKPRRFIDASGSPGRKWASPLNFSCPHRVEGPAVEFDDGGKFWYKRGVLMFVEPFYGMARMKSP